jgi:phenylacetate-CoA ligase
LTVEKSKLICNSTSGSTGIQTNIYISKEEQSLIRAIQTTWWIWAGFKIGEPMFQTGLATKRSLEKKLKDIFFRTYYQFAFGLTTENTEKGLTWAKRTIPFLGGYASSLFVLSEIAKGRGITMKSAVSWGDKLFDHYRKNIEQVFDCKVFETYGTGEGLMLGAQKDLDYLYIMDPYFIVELLDDDGNEVADGEIGQVVVTSLIHKSMPLIRYRVGDLAIKLPRSLYPANRELNLSLFQKIIGRETDIVETPLGRKLVVHSFTGVFEYYPEIKQFQVYQRNRESLEIRYIPGANFNVDVLEKIKIQLNELATEYLVIFFVEVNEILPSKSGKPQIIIKEL